MGNKWIDIAVEVAELVKEKNDAYGDAFAKSGEFLKLLYPYGIAPDQYGDMLTLVRMFDKQMRIATDKDALGESPWKDVLGYALLAVEIDERKPGALQKSCDTCIHDEIPYPDGCNGAVRPVEGCRDQWVTKEQTK